MSLRIAAVAVAVISSAAASAQAPPAATPAVVAKIKDACATDLQKLCADTGQDKGKRRACLDSHKAELSPPCTAAREARAKP